MLTPFLRCMHTHATEQGKQHQECTLPVSVVVHSVLQQRLDQAIKQLATVEHVRYGFKILISLCLSFQFLISFHMT